MKKPELYNILYKGRRIYTKVSHEECLDILDEMAENFYNDQIEPEYIEMEKI